MYKNKNGNILQQQKLAFIVQLVSHIKQHKKELIAKFCSQAQILYRNEIEENYYNSKNMKKQQILYSVGEMGYEQVSKASNDPIIMAAKERNVQLGYRVCNQIHKGQSYFIDPIAEQLYMEYMMSKSQNAMKKSQLTLGSTQCNSSSQNFFKSSAISKTGEWEGNEKAGDFADKNNSKLEIMKNKQSSSCILNSANSRQRNCNQLIADEVLSENQSASEVEMLRRTLSQKQRELQRCKRQLHTYKNQTKIKMHQTSDHKNAAKWDANKELGGTLPALMYLTVLMVLFAKHTLAQ